MASKVIEPPEKLKSLEDANDWAEYILVATANGQINSSQAFALQRMLMGSIKLNVELPLKVAQLTARSSNKGLRIKRTGGWGGDMAPQISAGKAED